ncbi:MAG: M23 family metallopeptidase [Rhodospirillales bacterium]
MSEQRYNPSRLLSRTLPAVLNPRFFKALLIVVGIGCSIAIYSLINSYLDQSKTGTEATSSPAKTQTTPSAVFPKTVRLPADPLAASNPTEAEAQISSGDTLSAVLDRMGVSNEEAFRSITALRKVYDPRSLKKGDTVTLSLSSDATDDGNGRLLGLQVNKSFDRIAGVGLTLDGNFEAYEIVKSLDVRSGRGRGNIQTSILEDGIKEGIPTRVMGAFIRLFSFDIDFQRDIKPGDKFDVLFDQYVDYDGSVVQAGDILYASLTTGKRTISLYRHEFSDGQSSYFNDQGRSNRKALLKTPIDGARISSGFGRRKHPILGYSKMHAGVDFAAPSGTPIRAAGDGVVRRSGWNGGYGRYVRIRHNSIYQTAYAHMRRIAKGIRPGVRVQQGQVIGYVGSSGRSTGPHLHYEILKQGKQVNPRKVNFQSAEKLAGDDLKRFNLFRNNIDNFIKASGQTG